MSESFFTLIGDTVIGNLTSNILFICRLWGQSTNLAVERHVSVMPGPWWEEQYVICDLGDADSTWHWHPVCVAHPKTIGTIFQQQHVWEHLSFEPRLICHMSRVSLNSFQLTYRKRGNNSCIRITINDNYLPTNIKSAKNNFYWQDATWK